MIDKELKMKQSIKFLVSLLTIPLLLTGCFASDEEEVASTTEVYETSNFSISIPQDWEILEESEFTSNIPQSTIVAFRNNIKNEIFNANVNISVQNTNLTDPSDLAKSSKANAKTSLISFQEIETKDIEVKSGDGTIKGTLMEFQGKKSAQESMIRFKQLYIIRGNTAYTITTAYLPDEDGTVVQYIDEMLNSFALK
ncbi:hypothetical protein GF366_02605 [Candidatus Peregrinibacteria bacterium]|nr:hypothetical protein [Candidatus Peregrinibacteria bacterium]